MIRSEFPDLNWLKTVVTGQQSARDGEGLANKHRWPNCIINAFTTAAYRPGVRGPISIFMNLKGVSHCSTNGPTATIHEDFFYLSNQNQEYTLTIERDEPVETFNIHLGEDLSEQVLSGLVTPADQLLNESFGLRSENIGFANRLYRKDETIGAIIQNLHHDYKSHNLDPLKLEDYNYRLMVYLLLQHRLVLKEVQRLPVAKKSTKAELHRRLSYSLDYLHGHQGENIELQKLAEEACLSKYHFLRLFKIAFDCSPYQYLQQLRIRRATDLLKIKELPINQIAQLLGFENATSFSRLFYQKFGTWPSSYRQLTPG